MFNDDGGVGTTSSSVRRWRSSRGVFPGGIPVSLLDDAFFVRRFAVFFGVFLTGLRRDEALVERAAGRRLADGRGFDDLARRAALRLAMFGDSGASYITRIPVRFQRASPALAIGGGV